MDSDAAHKAEQEALKRKRKVSSYNIRTEDAFKDSCASPMFYFYH
jgi:hypothetical protein